MSESSRRWWSSASPAELSSCARTCSWRGGGASPPPPFSPPPPPPLRPGAPRPPPRALPPFARPGRATAAAPGGPAGDAPGVHLPLRFRNLRLQWLELGDQLFALGRAERRGVADVMHGAFLVVEAEQQRAQRRSVVGLAPPDHDAVGRALVLDLHPQPLAGHVRAGP